MVPWARSPLARRSSVLSAPERGACSAAPWNRRRDPREDPLQMSPEAVRHSAVTPPFRCAPQDPIRPKGSVCHLTTTPLLCPVHKQSGPPPTESSCTPARAEGSASTQLTFTPGRAPTSEYVASLQSSIIPPLGVSSDPKGPSAAAQSRSPPPIVGAPRSAPEPMPTSCSRGAARFGQRGGCLNFRQRGGKEPEASSSSPQSSSSDTSCSPPVGGSGLSRKTPTPPASPASSGKSPPGAHNAAAAGSEAPPFPGPTSKSTLFHWSTTPVEAPVKNGLSTSCPMDAPRLAVLGAPAVSAGAARPPIMKNGLSTSCGAASDTVPAAASPDAWSVGSSGMPSPWAAPVPSPTGSTAEEAPMASEAAGGSGAARVGRSAGARCRPTKLGTRSAKGSVAGAWPLPSCRGG